MFLEVDWSRRKRLSQLLEGKRTIWSKGGAPFTQKRVFGLMAPEEVTWIFMQSNPHRIECSHENDASDNHPLVRLTARHSSALLTVFPFLPNT